MSTPENYKMNDHSIAHVAKLIQIALLTGTDIVDHLRSLEFSLDDNNDLVPSEKSLAQIGSEIESMFTDLENDAQNQDQMNFDPNVSTPGIFEV